jgi:hypothetical protein
VAALQDKRLALHVRGGIAFHGRRDRFVFGRNEVPRGLGTPCGPADLGAKAGDGMPIATATDIAQPMP